MKHQTNQVQHSQTYVSASDVESVCQQMVSGNIMDSERTQELENWFKAYSGSAAADATCSGTLALVSALRSVGVGSGDTVMAPTYVCGDVVDAIHYVGAVPEFCDLDEATLNVSVADASDRIGQLQDQGQAPKALVVAHLFGRAVDFRDLIGRGVPIIEDCSHGIGALVDGRPIGSIGEASVYSFQALKAITCGEGGLVAYGRTGRPDPLARHYHLSNISASLALSQLARLDSTIAQRRRIASWYEAGLCGLNSLRLHASSSDASWVPLRVCVEFGGSVSVEAVMNDLRMAGFIARRPVKGLRHIEKHGHRRLEFSERRYDHILSLPAHLHVTESDVDRICTTVQESLK